MTFVLVKVGVGIGKFLAISTFTIEMSQIDTTCENKTFVLAM